MKEEAVRFLWYYLSKRIINNAKWDEARRRFYVRLGNDYISLTADEWEYLAKIVEAK